MKKSAFGNTQADISERDKIEQAHHEWMSVLDVIEDPIFLHDKECRVLRCNRAYQQRARISFEEIIGQHYYEVFPKTTAKPACCFSMLEKTEAVADEDEILVGDIIYRLRALSVNDKQGDYLYSVHILEDITERTQIEKELQESETRYRRITEGLTDYQYTVGIENGRAIKTTQSPACVTVTGYTADEFAANPHLWIQMVVPEDRERVMEHVNQILAGNDGSSIEHRITRKNGAVRWISDTIILFRDVTGKLLSYDGVIKDITERKLAEKNLEREMLHLQAIMRTARDGFHIINSEGLLLEANQSFLNLLGFDESIVGHLHVDDWHATEDREFLREKMAELVQQEATATFETKHRRKDGSLLDVEVSVSVFHRDGEPLMFAASRDITERKAAAMSLSIANKELVFQNEEKKKRAAELVIANKQLQDSLNDTVRAIATIVEMRDPYTSGHQVRVADLSAAIAKQLGMPDEQVHAIHLAGVVHDLGKIKVPAEILSKPGRITDIEFSLIKVHPQAGYDILKGINFPWPIAQMVLQHHERLDGSGYPQGLKGEQIIIEARILSVADVVEAICSHRPYRPGLGIDVALAEITKQRGVYYDSQVVDACLAVFHEHGYKFSV